MKDHCRVIAFLIFLTCLAAGVSVAAQGPMRQAERPVDPEYSKLIEKVQNGETAVDYKALRIAYARSGFPGARGVDPKVRAKLVDAVKANKFGDIAKIAEEILKVNPMDINTRVVAASAYQEIKDAKKYDYHQAVYLGLINSIVNAADGESAKTAYVVISRDEIIAVLRAYELQSFSSAEITEGTDRFMVVTATDKTNGGTSKVYFNVNMVPKLPEAPSKQ